MSEIDELKARIMELEEALIEQARYEVDRGDGSVDLVIDDDVIEILNRTRNNPLKSVKDATTKWRRGLWRQQND